jgi:hypothetical protein
MPANHNQVSFSSPSSGPAPNDAAGQLQEQLNREVTIRTMRDDLTVAKKQPNGAVAPAPATPEKNMPPAGPTAQPAGQTPPLSARPQAKAPGGVQQPQTRRKRSIIGVLVKTVVMLVMLSLAGAGGWLAVNYLSDGVGDIGEDDDMFAVSEVIPRDALFVMQYSLENTANRFQIRQMWGIEEDNTPISFTQFLNGNPELVLADSEAHSLYYVLLPDDPRLYVIVPRTEYIEEALAQYTDVQVLRKGSWYILHPISVNTYTQALEDGNMSATEGLLEVPQQFSMRLIIDPAYVGQLHELAYHLQGVGTQQAKITINASFDAQQSTVQFTTNNLGFVTKEEVRGQDLNLLQFIPRDVIHVHVGSNFAQDAAVFQDSGTLELHTAVLEQPAVQQLISELTGMYAYYIRQGEGQRQDIGLILELPEDMQRTLENEDETVETALQALIPLVTGRSITRSIAFTDGERGDMPLRYVNLAGHEQALDYTITDTHIFFASSKDGMFTLADTIMGEEEAVTASPWQRIIQQEAISLGSQSFTLQILQHSLFTRILPHENGASFLFGVSLYSRGDMQEVQGGVLINQ